MSHSSNTAVCDFGHEAEEVRLLPTGGGGNIIVCGRHYKYEIAFRKATNWESSATFDAFPEWEMLKVGVNG